MKNQISYSPEVRKRAVRLVFEQQKEYESQWSAIKSIALKIDCTAETLRTWVKRMETDQGAGRHVDIGSGKAQEIGARESRIKARQRDIPESIGLFCERMLDR